MVLPFGKLALRHWTLGGFTEQGGAGIGLTAGRDSKTVFVPELGVRLGAELSNGGYVSIRPFGKLSYTFQGDVRSEEHKSELQSLMLISYAVFCLKTKTNITHY